MSLSKIFESSDNFTAAKIESVDYHPQPADGHHVYHPASTRGDSPSEMQETTVSADSNTSENLEAVKKESFNLGKQEGLKLAEQQFHETVNAMATALENISGLREKILKNSNRDMVRLVRVICEKIIQAECSVNQEIILNTINNALHSAVESDEFHIKINPADFDLVNEKKPLFLASISGLKDIYFEVDPDVARGGCLVESNLGRVDATIDSQLDEIQAHLEKMVEKET